jgi:hypothetical protein
MSLPLLGVQFGQLSHLLPCYVQHRPATIGILLFQQEKRLEVLLIYLHLRQRGGLLSS